MLEHLTQVCLNNQPINASLKEGCHGLARQGACGRQSRRRGHVLSLSIPGIPWWLLPETSTNKVLFEGKEPVLDTEHGAGCRQNILFRA